MGYLGLCAYLGMFVLVLFLSGSISAFLDIPSLLLIGGGVLIPVWARHGKEGIFGLFMGEDENVFYTASIAALLTGALGSLIGLVLMLQNLSDPSAIGPAMAVSLLTLVYGILISMLCFVRCRKLRLPLSVFIIPLMACGLAIVEVGLLIHSIG